MAAYALFVRVPPPDMEIIVAYIDTKQRKQRFQVTPENAMVLQSKDVSKTIYTLTVTCTFKYVHLAIHVRDECLKIC